MFCKGVQMKIKQTTFYALAAIRRIHLENREIVTSTVIAEKEGLSQGVILRILRMMADASILSVHQGRGNRCGGFSLERSIDELTLLDVVNVMETLDICENLDQKAGINDDELFLSLSEINHHVREEFSKHTIRELFKL